VLLTDRCASLRHLQALPGLGDLGGSPKAIRVSSSSAVFSAPLPLLLLVGSSSYVLSDTSRYAPRGARPGTRPTIEEQLEGGWDARRQLFLPRHSLLGLGTYPGSVLARKPEGRLSEPILSSNTTGLSIPDAARRFAGFISGQKVAIEPRMAISALCRWRSPEGEGALSIRSAKS